MTIELANLRASLEAILPLFLGEFELALASEEQRCDSEPAVLRAGNGDLCVWLAVQRRDETYQAERVVFVRASDQRESETRLRAYIQGWALGLAEAVASHPEFEPTPGELVFPELFSHDGPSTTETVRAALLAPERLGGIGTQERATYLWRQSMERMGLGDNAEQLRSYVVSSARMQLYLPDDELAVGCTRVGGSPDVGSGFEWPRFRGLPMSFIAQLDLSQLAEYDASELLPREGWLYFFYDARQEAAGFDPQDRGSCRVLYWVGEREELVRTSLPSELPESARLPACGVDLEREDCVPPLDSPHYEVPLGPLPVGPRCDAVVEFINQCGANADSSEPIHRVLGHPEPVQGDMYTECQLVTNGLSCGAPTDTPPDDRVRAAARDWQLLLQLDSDDADDWTWGDGGRLYFWIRRDDLAARRFDSAWAIVQCH